MTNIRQSDIPALIGAGSIPPEKFSHARELLRPAPLWDRWALLALFALGVGHFLAGVIFFFAFNWNDLSAFQKFGLIGAGMTASVAIWIWQKLDGLAGAWGIAATIFIGVMFAVLGQVYQTPANLYTPFTMWALLSLPFVLMSKSRAHWAVWIAIATVAGTAFVNEGLRLTQGQAVGNFGNLLIGVLFLAGFWLYGHLTKPEKHKANWFGVYTLIVGLGFIITAFSEGYWEHSALHWLLSLSILLGLFGVIYRFRPAVATLSLTLFAIFINLSQIIFDLIDQVGSFDVFQFFLGFVWLVAATTVLALGFRHFVEKFPTAEIVAPEDDSAEFDRSITAEMMADRLAVQVDDPAAWVTEKQTDKMPWYIEFLLAIAGIATAIAAGGFVGAVLITGLGLENGSAFMIAGLIIFGVSLFFRRKTNQIFLRHFLNTLIVTGAGLIMVGTIEPFEKVIVICGTELFWRPLWLLSARSDHGIS